MLGTRSSAAGSSPQVQTKRAESGPAFPLSTSLAEGGPAYERDFGFRADFRAGLHCGPVLVGELGFVKKEIALIGDTMNTTQRIQDACREANCRVLVSAALLDRIVALPAGVWPPEGSASCRCAARSSRSRSTRWRPSRQPD
jgi:class 3 adenylate cyclase